MPLPKLIGEVALINGRVDYITGLLSNLVVPMYLDPSGQDQDENLDVHLPHNLIVMKNIISR